MEKASMPLVSVIVPVYNVERYLEDCIKSIINQTYPNLEIILIDDGSTDCSGTICDSFAGGDERIHVIHQENKGLSGARNAGMDICTGEYITFVDSDDFVDLEMIEVMVQEAVENQIDIVLCGMVTCNCDGELISSQNAEKKELYRNDLLKHLFYNKHYPVSACSKLYAKNILKNIRFPLGKYHEDMFVAHEILYYADSISILNRALYWYRQVGGSITHQTFSEKHLDAIEAYTNQVQFFKKKCPRLVEEARAALAYTSCKCAERMIVADYYNEKQEEQIRTIVKKNLSCLIRRNRYSMETKAFAICYSINTRLMRRIYKRIRR